MNTASAATHEVEFISGVRLLAFRLGFGLRSLKYVLLKRKYPLFRLGIGGDGVLKTSRLMRNIGLRKVVRMGDRMFMALTAPHYPSQAFDNMMAHGGFNAASPGTANNRQISTALLAISGTCNLHCKHCYEQFNIDNKAEVPKARWKEVIHSLQQRGTSVIVLSGGEPMLRFSEVLDILRSGDKELSDFHLHTSGQGVTPEKAYMLKEAGLTAAAVGLDDVDETRHDALRGCRGSYRDAVDALKYFHAAGVFTYVNLCATKELVRSGDLWKYFDLVKSLNVGFIQMLEPRPAGGYLQNGIDGLLDDCDRNILMQFFEKGNSKKKFMDYPIIYYLAHAESPEQAGCTMGGLFHFHIDSKGNVNPCVFLPVAFGNIMEESFDPIFARMREAIPRPLHVKCPSLQLGGVMKRALAQKTDMPIPYDLIKAEWQDALQNTLKR
jgi:MoaA/NifB/PqqE/SkfB family radical SAM enzyme